MLISSEMKYMYFIIPIPMEKIDLKKFDFPGVYFFVKNTYEEILEIYKNHPPGKFLDDISVLYIGKAHRINRRLLDYRIFSQNEFLIKNKKNPLKNQGVYNIYKESDKFIHDSHENIKKNRLGRVCKSLIIKRSVNHFQACFEEIEYIKKYLPLFNKKLKSTPKTFLVHADNQGLSLTQKKILSRKNEINDKGSIVISGSKKIRKNFYALLNIIRALENNVRLVLSKFQWISPKDKYLYCSPSSFFVQTKYGFSYSLQREVEFLLNGKKNLLVKHVYQDMLEASQIENYLEAANLRDLYFQLTDLQKTISRSKKMRKKFKFGKFIVQASKEESPNIFYFKCHDHKHFVLQYEKLLLVNLWLKRKWENCRWENLTRSDINNENK